MPFGWCCDERPWPDEEMADLQAEIARLNTQTARLIAAGDALRWACRHLVKELPTTATRDWTEWNDCVRRWLEAKDERRETKGVKT
uniref:Uncharacterized protein n=1 Tax=viral metagenome TaxID=1070528 RepID=A0A6M3L757_9ZZZZ